MGNRFDYDNLLHDSLEVSEKPSINLLNITKEQMRGSTKMEKQKRRVLPTLLLIMAISLALPATALGAYTVYNNFRITRGAELIEEYGIEIFVEEDGSGTSVRMTDVTVELTESDEDEARVFVFEMTEGEDGMVEIGIDKLDVVELDIDEWDFDEWDFDEGAFTTTIE